MKKQILLGAAALTTVVLTAGSAAAQQYTLVFSADTDIATETVAGPTTLASELTLTNTNSKGILPLAVVPSATAILPGGNAILTLSLTGGHTFGTALTPGAIVQQGAGCQPTRSISSGGAKGDSTVSFLLSTLGGCVTGSPILVALPVDLGPAAALSITSTFKTEGLTSIDGGSAFLTDGVKTTQINAVSFAPAFDVEILADGTASTALLPDFEILSEGVLGTVEITHTARQLGIQTGAAATAATDLDAITYTVEGNLDEVTIDVDGDDLVETAGVGEFTDATLPAPGTYDITATEDGGTIVASDYDFSVDLDLDDLILNDPATFGADAIQSIDREGSTYLIPWVASGTLAQTNGNSSVIRISNIGSSDTGTVSVELLSASTAIPASTALVTYDADGIPAGDELVITGASLETLLGNFGRGDVRITVEGDLEDLITRRFLQNVTNGSVTEVSLGRDNLGSEGPN